MTTADLTNIVTNPITIPAAKNGIKYCTKFREYKLKVCINISPTESSLWNLLFSIKLSSVRRMLFRAYNFCQVNRICSKMVSKSSRFLDYPRNVKIKILRGFEPNVASCNISLKLPELYSCV